MFTLHTNITVTCTTHFRRIPGVRSPVLHIMITVPSSRPRAFHFHRKVRGMCFHRSSTVNEKLTNRGVEANGLNKFQIYLQIFTTVELIYGGLSNMTQKIFSKANTARLKCGCFSSSSDAAEMRHNLFGSYMETLLQHYTTHGVMARLQNTKSLHFRMWRCACSLASRRLTAKVQGSH